MKLDIIVTHYNEPYSIVKPFFDMMELQFAKDYSDFRVILVHDGEDQKLPELSSRSFPFELVEITMPHKGVSAARNAGMDYSDAEWITFCDCDDTFVSRYAIYEILSVLDTKDYDLLWFPFYINWKDQNIRTRHEATIQNIHSKVFRRSFLKEKNLRFCDGLRYAEDMAFVTIANEELDKKRIGRINSNMPLYVVVQRYGSTTTTVENRYRNMVGLVQKQIYISKELKRRGYEKQSEFYAARTMVDAYLLLCRNDFDESREAVDIEVQELYKENRDAIRSMMSKETYDVMLNAALNEFGYIYKHVPVSIPFDKWLDGWVRLHHLDE